MLTVIIVFVAISDLGSTGVLTMMELIQLQAQAFNQLMLGALFDSPKLMAESVNMGKINRMTDVSTTLPYLKTAFFQDPRIRQLQRSS